MKKIAALLAVVLCLCALAAPVAALSKNGSYGKVPMYDGKITNNTGADTGGGVYVAQGNMTMNGGTIIDNAADYLGGGVDVSGKMTMNGGTISGNKVLGPSVKPGPRAQTARAQTAAT